uniref:C2H2-type domain-containing protein n=1 Tax=Plectus sambesii TaxID=2011161 RepID=A0A914WIE3_9BILA
MEVSHKSRITSGHGFEESEAQMTDGEQCLCCEAAFGCKVELFSHLKSKHWDTIFGVLMMGPGSDPVERWIDDILNNKRKYDGIGVSNKGETLLAYGDHEQMKLSDIAEFPVVSQSDLVPSPDESLKRSNSKLRLERSDCREAQVDEQPHKETSSFHTFDSNGDGGMSNAARVDSESVNFLQKVPEEKPLTSSAHDDDMSEGCDEGKKTSTELEQQHPDTILEQHPEAVVDEVEKSAACAEENADWCRSCGELVEERLPHVLQTHLKAKIFRCRECSFFSHSRPKDLFDHISAEHPADVGSLHFFSNHLDEHRVGIEQLLLYCFGVDDPFELTAVMCGSSIRGYLDGLEFFRRALQADPSMIAPPTEVSAAQPIIAEPNFSEAFDKPEPNRASKEASQDNCNATTNAAFQSAKSQKPSMILHGNDSEQPSTVAQMEVGDDNGAKVAFDRVADAARLTSLRTNVSQSALTAVQELVSDFRNIDEPELPTAVVEEPMDSVPPLRRRRPNRSDPPGSLDSPTVCQNLEAQSEIHHGTADESVTSPVDESPSILALRSSRNRIVRTHSSRRSARMTPSSSQQQQFQQQLPQQPQQQTIASLDQSSDEPVVPRSLRRTPGRQALAAELRAAALSSQTALEAPSKRHALKRPSSAQKNESMGKSRRSRTPPPTTPSKERLHSLRSHPHSAAEKSASTPVAGRSVAGRTKATAETSPTVSRKSLRRSFGERSNPIDAHSREKSPVESPAESPVESQADAAINRRKLRRSTISPTANKSEQPACDVETTATPNSEKEVTCKECSVVLKFRERKRHVLRQHVRLPLYECPVEGCSFSSYTNLSHCREHISNVHKRSGDEIIDNRSKYQRQIDEWMHKCL